MRSISIVIPAYNEEKRIVPSLHSMIDYLNSKRFDYEIIVVDDGSKDNTIKAVKKVSRKIRILTYGENRGKGYAVKTGMLAATKAWVLFSDADLSTPIDELERFSEFALRYNVIIGSRAVKGADIQVRQPFYRVMMGKVFNALVQILAVPGIWDTQCGFKLFSRPAAQAVFSRTTIEGFGFDVEALFIAQKLGFKIAEIPIRWKNDEETKVDPVKDALRMFKDLWTINKNSWNKVY